ncbi:MAG: response regulator transcription factor [Rhodocyclaceae bacterium]|jgi:two-component system invasion response regulator UvrY|nr:response regulator transcription factor [Rhodocyclaceae bacterium]
MNILIVDDHPIVRHGLRLLLETRGAAKRVGEAADAAEAMERLREGGWEVMVLDIDLPDRSGLEVLRDAKARWPTLPVLILSIHPENMLAVRLLKSGAAGYLNKDSAPAELVEAVRRVAAGGRYISAAMAQLLAEQIGTDPAREPHERLSEREYQVFRLLAAGTTVGAIAEQLHLSVNTVSTYRARVLEKLGAANNAELMRYAAERRLV